MKKEILLLPALLSLFLICGCGNEKEINNQPPVITRKTVKEAGEPEKNQAEENTQNEGKEEKETKEINNEPAAVDSAAPAEPAIPPQNRQSEKKNYPRFEYPYDLEEDRRNFDYDHIDIIVGDKLYMTQINDWYINFRDYRNKTVLIEGYFLSINGHYFVGRNGPTCPYCTGGYVDFEFTSDQNFTGWKPGITWIKVYGILREATVHLNGRMTAPFYHLEAIRVEKSETEGIGTITD